jgi:acyl-[acyl carrier protein]--UDP-N-acetylglucosamine O-acyltransferase
MPESRKSSGSASSLPWELRVDREDPRRKPLKWTPLTAFYLAMKNITGSGKWARRYFLSQGYNIHPSAIFGGDVVLDSLNPERITIHEGATIGNGVLVVAHGAGIGEPITIGRNAYVGARSVVMHSIGANALVGAGSIVTEPVPMWETWAGNPAREIR